MCDFKVIMAESVDQLPINFLPNTLVLPQTQKQQNAAHYR